MGDLREFVVATYTLETDDLAAAAWAIACGQTIGNPTCRTRYDTPEFLAQWCGKLLTIDEKTQQVTIGFPVTNFADSDGLNHLLCVLMGGQMDIGLIKGCVLERLVLPETFAARFAPPRFGVAGLRQLLDIPTRPFLCGIIKPKLGLTPEQHLAVCQQMAEGGCDVIKEDEIWGGNGWRLKHRLWRELLDPYPQLLYLSCGNGDGLQIDLHALHAHHTADSATHQRHGLHVNVWCSLGSVRWLADFETKGRIPLMFQKSGDRLWTTGPYRISDAVWYQLIRLTGADIAHIGMVGGYLDEPPVHIQRRIDALRPAIPSFSCGMKPKLVKPIVEQFGRDVMLTSGGYIHSHPDGIVAGCRAMREAIDKAVVTQEAP